MRAFYKIIISDYLQRTRSYAFLITLAISLYAAYSFVPAPNAAYTTLRIGNYLGADNAAWIGSVTAMMTSVFLSIIGFYLVNSGIKKDVDTGVGMIIATTSISNFNYLLAKAWSNFLVLLSIMCMVLLMSIALFLIRSGEYPFDIMQFILPYLLVTVPAIFFVAAIAVVAEVFLYRYNIVMNIGVYFIFCVLLASQTTISPLLDVFGIKQVTATMQDIIQHQYHQANHTTSMGFIFGHKKTLHSFVFEGVTWTAPFIFSRILLMCLGLLLILISSRFFHRFDIKQTFKKKKKSKIQEIIAPVKPLRDIRLSALPPIKPNFGIIPFIKTELLMLFRKGPRWLWLINVGGMIALIFAPLTVAHQMILPALWFLQVARWSDLATKEKTNRIHYFTYASYKPLTRLLPAQVFAGIILSFVLALPLFVRYLVAFQFLPILSIIMGSIFIVLLAVALGMLSGGTKLFEILFFLFTYSNLNKVPFTDYFGGINHSANYLVVIAVLIASLTFMSFLLRKIEIRHL
ncbi:MAG: hypothetical protein JWP37_4313 [Mucilaginibacter sp.]|nr:hypothetical protein [Mucilaginibacter sp.]